MLTFPFCGISPVCCIKSYVHLKPLGTHGIFCWQQISLSNPILWSNNHCLINVVYWLSCTKPSSFPESPRSLQLGFYFHLLAQLCQTWPKGIEVFGIVHCCFFHSDFAFNANKLCSTKLPTYTPFPGSGHWVFFHTAELYLGNFPATQFLPK